MKTKTISLGIATLFIGCAHADMDCSKGAAWRLPLPPGTWKHVEAPIKVDGKAGQMVLVCNCTADVAGKNTGVWVRASPSSEGYKLARDASTAKDGPQAGGGTTPYYLPGRSCVLAGTETIVLAPTDNVESWGWFQTQQ